ncbi:hypothetical protein TKK_0018426 [Trichogramma kaykai]|uniref:Peptidase S1 domain-containing protein n=1 Tax=Trichogramma kaykai TaxID=54128 RepID=A0ABD2VYW6_9HYME
MRKKSFFSLFLGLQLIDLITSNAIGKNRTIKGEFALPGQFPHQVSIQAMTLRNCTEHFCGGSIIDRWHILTAAHCFTNQALREFLDIPWTVVAGTVDLKDRDHGVYRDVDTIFIPYNYTENEIDEFDYDIAVLKLREPMPIGIEPYIDFVDLPRPDQYLPPDHREAVMSGFGTYYQTDMPDGEIVSGPISQFLRFARAPINVEEPGDGCYDDQVCVEAPDHLGGFCFGDSGGPLYDEDLQTLIGVISHHSHYYCGDVSKYTRVSAYLDFIKAVRDDKFDDYNMVWYYNPHNYSLEYPKLSVCDI